MSNRSVPAGAFWDGTGDPMIFVAAPGALMKHAENQSYLLVFAHVLSSLFLWDGILQFRNPGATAQCFASVHVPLPDLAAWILSAIHSVVGLGLLVRRHPH